jgi:hypothetical protein
VQNVLGECPDWTSIHLLVGVELIERTVRDFGGFNVDCGDGGGP